VEDLDPVSVHALACAGGEMAEHLTRKAGAEPFAEHALATFPDLQPRKLRRLRNQYWDAFKRATARDGQAREDQELLEPFSSQQNDHALLIGWYDYERAIEALPIEAPAFQAWYFALYPGRLNPAFDGSAYEALFPGLREMSCPERKKALREAIGRARAKPSIMAHPRDCRATDWRLSSRSI
jgi:hypothetical protein